MATKTKETRVQVPDVTHSLYGGKIHIDFYEKYVKNGHAYFHVYIVRETGEWPISVTNATGMVDKSRPLGIWQERLCREFLQAKLNKKTGIFELTDEVIIEATSQYRIKKEEGASIGDQTHKWIEDWVAKLNPEMPTDPRVLNGVSAFLKWFKDSEAEIVASEQIVYSRDYAYVGKYDAKIKWKIPGRGNKRFLSIADFKTNNWKVDKKTGKSESVLYPEQRYQFAGYKGAHLEEFPKEDLGPNLMIALDKETGALATHTIDDHEKDYECFLAALTLKKRDKELSRGW